MKIFRQLIQFTLMAIAFAISSTLASCSSSPEEERYQSVVKELRSIDGIIFKEKRSRTKFKKTEILTAEIDVALQNGSFEYADKYLALLEAIWKHSNNETLTQYKEKVKREEVTYLISLKSEDAANRITSIVERPTRKPTIGESCSVSTLRNGYTSSVLADYYYKSTRLNYQLDEYLRIALMQQNDIAAQKILELYVEVPRLYEYTERNYEYVKIRGFSDQPKKDALKRYKEAKENPQSLEN